MPIQLPLWPPEYTAYYDGEMIHIYEDGDVILNARPGDGMVVYRWATPATSPLWGIDIALDGVYIHYGTDIFAIPIQTR